MTRSRKPGRKSFARSNPGSGTNSIDPPIIRRSRGVFLDVEDDSRAENTKPNVTDADLALAAVLGDVEAFSELARRYRRAAVRTAAAIAGVDAAEDIAQDALLLAWKALPDLDEPDRFAAWLSAITRNRALRWLQREGRAVQVEFSEELLTSLQRIAANDQRGKEAASQLWEGMDELPESCRLIMRLRWLDEMPMQQIAAFTGLPLSTVKWRLHEGKKRLREWATEREATETSSGTR